MYRTVPTLQKFTQPMFSGWGIRSVTASSSAKNTARTISVHAHHMAVGDVELMMTSVRLTEIPRSMKIKTKMTNRAPKKIMAFVPGL